MKSRTFIYHPLVLLVLYDLEDLPAVASEVGKAGMGGKGLSPCQLYPDLIMSVL